MPSFDDQIPPFSDDSHRTQSHHLDNGSGKKPELYRPLGRETLRERVQALSQESIEPTNTDSSNIKNHKRYKSMASDSHRQTRQTSDNYYVDLEQKRSQAKEQIKRAQPVRVPTKLKSTSAPRTLTTESGMSRERQLVNEQKVKYERRQRRKKILMVVAAVLAVLVMGVGILVNYVTSGARLDLRESELPENFTLPPMGVDVDRDLEATDEHGSLIVNLDSVASPSWSENVEIPDGSQSLASGAWSEGVTNILLLGVDTRDMSNLNTRSDTMMVVSLDHNNNQLKLLSLQRDMLVYIPGYESEGERKINEVMYFGPDKAMETVNYYLNLNIQEYVVVNIAGAEKIVDAIGGISIDVPTEPEVLDYYNACIHEQNVMMEDNVKNHVSYFEEGGSNIKVNGRQAIAYARMREKSDYQRMDRQQEVLQKLFTEMKKADPVRLTQTIKAGFDQIATNYSLSDLVGLANEAMPVLSGTLGQMSLPVKGTNWEDSQRIWVNRVNFNLNIPYVHEYLYGDKASNEYYLVPNVMNAPPDFTKLRVLPEKLVLNPLAPGYHEIGKEWPILSDVDWEGDPSTSP